MSDEQTTGTPKRPRVTVAPRSVETAFSVEDIVQRRIQQDPFGAKELPIPLAEPGKWALKEANAEVDPGRHYAIVHRDGWVPLTPADLAPGVTAESIGYRVSEDGHLVRGVHGQERLYKMAKAHRDQIQLAKTAANKRGMGSAAKVRDDLASAAGSQMGDEAGSFIHQHVRLTGEDREGPLGG